MPGPWWCSSAAWVPPATCRPRRRVWERTSPSSEGTGQGFSSSGSSQAHRLRKQGSRKAAGSLRWVWERAHAGDLRCRWDARSVERAPVQSGFWPASRPPPSLSFPNPAPCLELRAARAATQVFTQTCARKGAKTLRKASFSRGRRKNKKESRGLRQQYGCVFPELPVTLWYCRAARFSHPAHACCKAINSGARSRRPP